MRGSKIYRAVSIVGLVLSTAAIAQADFTYNFDNLNGSPTPGTPLNTDLTSGSVGQDGWTLATGVSTYVRNDTPTGYTGALTGFSGNYAAGQVITAQGAATDSITTRLGANLGLGGSRYATFQFDGLVGPAGYSTTATPPVVVTRRSELAPGVDSNLDGDIRGTSSTAENSEVAFQFGYESTGSGWYLRKAAYNSTGTVTAATTASGIYTMQLVVDFNANPSTVVDNVHGGFVNDGSGTLYVKQIADTAGNPVNDVFRVASDASTNFNLGLSLMGGFGGADPANWNGMSMRTAQNGGLDNIKFSVGLPTTQSTWASDAGDWLKSGNWYIGVPNAVDAVANLTNGARVNATVYADSAITVGTLNFNNSKTYNVTGNGTLTLQTSSGSASINNAGGSQKVNIPLIIASNTLITAAAGTTLRISDPVTVNAGKSITQSGTGTVLYESTINVLSGGSIVFGNTLHAASLSLAGSSSATITDGAARNIVTLDGLSLATGSVVNINKNELIATMTPNATRLAILAGKIVSSSTSGTTGIGYGDVGGGKTEALYTKLGDATLDRVVNFDDLIKVAQNYNKTGQVWTDGDFTYDGVVNFDDLIDIAQNYNATLPGLTLPASVGAEFAADWAFAQSVVPEPTTLALLGLPLVVAAGRRRM